MHSVICSGLGSLEYFATIKCTKFGQLILRKIIKIVAIRCQILRLKCTKFDFGWATPQTPLGSLQRSPHPLAGFKGPTSKGREGKERREGGEGRGKEREGRGKRKGGESIPLALILQFDHWSWQSDICSFRATNVDLTLSFKLIFFTFIFAVLLEYRFRHLVLIHRKR